MLCYHDWHLKDVITKPCSYPSVIVIRVGEIDVDGCRHL